MFPIVMRGEHGPNKGRYNGVFTGALLAVGRQKRAAEAEKRAAKRAKRRLHAASQNVG